MSVVQSGHSLCCPHSDPTVFSYQDRVIAMLKALGRFSLYQVRYSDQTVNALADLSPWKLSMSVIQIAEKLLYPMPMCVECKWALLLFVNSKHMCGPRGGGGGQGARTSPLKNHKNIGFSSKTGRDPLKNCSYQASIQW